MNCGRNYPEVAHQVAMRRPHQITVLEYAHACGADHGRGRRRIRQIHPVRPAGAAFIRAWPPGRADQRARRHPAGPAGAGAVRGRRPHADAPHPDLPLHGRAAGARHAGHRAGARAGRGGDLRPLRGRDGRLPGLRPGHGRPDHPGAEHARDGRRPARPHPGAGPRPGRGHAAHPRARARHLREDGYRLPPPRARGLSGDRARRQESRGRAGRRSRPGRAARRRRPRGGRAAGAAGGVRGA